LAKDDIAYDIAIPTHQEREERQSKNVRSILCEEESEVFSSSSEANLDKRTRPWSTKKVSSPPVADGVEPEVKGGRSRTREPEILAPDVLAQRLGPQAKVAPGPQAVTDLVGGRARTNHLLEKMRCYSASEEVKALGIYPYFRALESAQAPVVTIGGRRLIMMGSNNYLGLVNDERVILAAQEAARKYGTGCAGSRLLNGTLDIHEELERRLAAFVGKEAALLYSTGFQANLGAISTLVGRRDTVVIDKRNHASIVDGVLLSRANCLRFRHNDMEHLAKVLAGAELSGSILVIVDGVFSMEGDIAPLPEILQLCRQHGAACMVDDAHGLGVLGQGGRGTSVHFGVVDQVDVVMGTFSKSLASIGGFIAAERSIVEYLKHNSRAMIFSASMPPASVASVLRALDIIEEEPERIERLWRNTRLLREALVSTGFDIGTSCTPIIPLILGDDQCAFRMCMRLHEEGVFVNPVPGLSLEPGRALLRVSVMATHEVAHLEAAVEKICKVGLELGVIGAG
jgi:8-amino-7-oxononanoate synthase